MSTFKTISKEEIDVTISDKKFIDEHCQKVYATPYVSTGAFSETNTFLSHAKCKKNCKVQKYEKLQRFKKAIHNFEFQYF